MFPLWDSPLRDAIDETGQILTGMSPTDQRGVLRVGDLWDIGAIEAV